MAVHPLAGKPAPGDLLIDAASLEREYYARVPDVEDGNQLVSFGTSGHRGTPSNGTFTERHILAITQAICDYRKQENISGPLYMGKDTHALSSAAQQRRSRFSRPTASKPSCSATAAPLPLRSSPAQFSFTTAAVTRVLPTASSSPPHTIRPPMAASSTTLRMAVRRTPALRAGSRTEPMICCAGITTAYGAFPTIRRFHPPPLMPKI